MFPKITKVNGASARTSLAGLRIHTVNGTACHTRDHSVSLLRKAKAGPVTVTAGSHNTMVGWVRRMGFAISEFQGG
ncbi:expressed unknown protein [Seminavis robusta]|uniref:Uncharacterized protein n=1 Tax=Seminavis robusta TaxID=568900 RepID=A0A9N8D843_9STRA|nr:expressed unknown protein [Seminavis robusta]|eukprot:Sro12_g009160.1 n/a (76) ;mRNA; f:29237-29560